MNRCLQKVQRGGGSFLTGWAGLGDEGLVAWSPATFPVPHLHSSTAPVEFIVPARQIRESPFECPRFLPAGLPKSLWDAILQFSALIAISYIQGLLWLSCGSFQAWWGSLGGKSMPYPEGIALFCPVLNSGLKPPRWLRG